MLNPKILPDRVRLLVIGGGIHGVGVAHDLASRGWRDVLLVEKGTIGQGTSSRSTKLIHGGLRYLQHIRDMGLVREGLKERRLLLKLAGDIVKPLEFVFPILKNGGMSSFIVRSGLYLYDSLAGSDNIQPHVKLSVEEALKRAPDLDTELFSKIYAFWDGQTDDLRLTRRVATSAMNLGATVAEHTSVESITTDGDGWSVKIVTADGKVKVVSALHVVNAAGPWANRILESSQIEPGYKGINVKGSHLMFDDIGLKSGLFLQAPKDGRIFFLLPWEGKTLVGTTESLFVGDQDSASVTEDEISYLLNNANLYLKKPLRKEAIIAKFAGLRWLALEPGRNVHATSRSHLISEHTSGRGILLTLYGGKLTAYRHVAELMGNMIMKQYGEDVASRTSEPETWADMQEELKKFPNDKSIELRYQSV